LRATQNCVAISNYLCRGLIHQAHLSNADLNRGHHLRSRGTNVRSSAGAEKDSEGMALKI